MSFAARSTAAKPRACPFVALAEDRDRRLDVPDPRHRCYAETEPATIVPSYQGQYCLSAGFAECAVFLAWAAAAAAAAPVAAATAAAAPVVATGMPAPSPGSRPGQAATPASATPASATPGAPPSGARRPEPYPDPAAEDPPGLRPRSQEAQLEALDWVPASAWASVPPDETAIDDDPARDEAHPTDLAGGHPAEADPLAASAVPADTAKEERTEPLRFSTAIALRRRVALRNPIRTTGSGEWQGGQPVPSHPLVRRRGLVTMAPIGLAVLGVLVLALLLFLVPTLLSGGTPRDIAGGAPDASPSPGASLRAASSVAPHASGAIGSPGAASPRPSPTPRIYVVRRGDTLSGIAARLGISMERLRCQNGIRDIDFLALGQELIVPPKGFTCPSRGVRRTPAPAETPSSDKPTSTASASTASASAAPASAAPASALPGAAAPPSAPSASAAPG